MTWQVGRAHPTVIPAQGGIRKCPIGSMPVFGNTTLDSRLRGNDGREAGFSIAAAGQKAPKIVNSAIRFALQGGKSGRYTAVHPQRREVIKWVNWQCPSA